MNRAIWLGLAKLQAAGAALSRFDVSNPFVKRVLVAFLVLWGIEFLGERAIDFMVKLETARATIQQKQADALKAEVQARALAGRPLPLPSARDTDDILSRYQNPNTPCSELRPIGRTALDRHRADIEVAVAIG
jgi:hypothetical protein